MAQDKTIDQFIADARPFARPIIAHWRALVRAAVPEARECIKWGMPHFTLDGKILSGMGAFKAHCSLIVEGAGARGGEGMGHFGRIPALADMPGDDVIAELLLARAQAIRSGARRSAKERAPKAGIALPDDLAAALAPQARAFLDSLTPAQQQEYSAWILDAKRPETRTRRIAQAAEWLAEGKKRNWKYEKC